jgi:NADH dehydrogenase (ubiquinone) Fe-S protein 5
VINQNDPQARAEGACSARLEDYYECLQHKKEVRESPTTLELPTECSAIQHARTQAIQDAYRKAEAAHPRENAPKAGSIRSLGLIGKEKETKSVMEAR